MPLPVTATLLVLAPILVLALVSAAVMLWEDIASARAGHHPVEHRHGARPDA